MSKNEGGTKIDENKNKDQNDKKRIINTEKDEDNKEQTNKSTYENSSTETSRPVKKNVTAKRKIDSTDGTPNKSSCWTSPRTPSRIK